MAVQYAALAEKIQPEDRVISTNPWVTNYYLGRVDGLLRERRVEDRATVPLPLALPVPLEWGLRPCRGQPARGAQDAHAWAWEE